MDLTRRDLLKLGAFGAGVLLLPVNRLVSATSQTRLAESALPRPYSTPFTIPRVLEPLRRDPDRDVYEVRMRQRAVEIIPGYRTTIWGYEGEFPGPTIVAEHGRPVRVRHINELMERHPTLGHRANTSVHLHGSASLPQFEGYASDVIPPGWCKDYDYANEQEARTAWYHDHGVHYTAPNVYHGLAGLFLVRDPLERSLPIPHGRYDIPLMVSDAMFATDGSLLFDDNDQSGVFGDVILVNGRPWPVMPVERRKYRFRILNASVTRSYRFRLSTGDPVTVIGTDGGLMPAPQQVQEFRHAPAERYEVVIDFSRYRVGQRIELRNLSNKNNIDYTNTGKVMAFEVTGDRTSDEGNTIPDVLNPDNPVMALRGKSSGFDRQFELDRSNGLFTINGKTWQDVIDSDFRAVLAKPALGAVETWEFENDSGGWHHPTHVHLIDFRILDRTVIPDPNEKPRGKPRPPQASPPMPQELGPKDTVYLGESERVRVVARFGPHPGRYMIHCHNSSHEDHDMMGQFEVGEGGQDPLLAAPARPVAEAPPL